MHVTAHHPSTSVHRTTLRAVPLGLRVDHVATKLSVPTWCKPRDIRFIYLNSVVPTAGIFLQLATPTIKRCQEITRTTPTSLGLSAITVSDTSMLTCASVISVEWNSSLHFSPATCPGSTSRRMVYVWDVYSNSLSMGLEYRETGAFIMPSHRREVWCGLG
ncbi:hypothetical protein B0H12DRAFT_426191 [Mycena haematopus]|nr:hypothetical protein B0H12DRAFT_426191 [Mycena haematopus]